MITYQSGIVPKRSEVLALYHANRWSSADKPDQLMAALAGSDHIECAYDQASLVGLANAISDGHLVVHYPHLLVHPDRQGHGIGHTLMSRMLQKYSGFHQHTLLAVSDATAFYEKVGFERAETITPMWVYSGSDG